MSTHPLRQPPTQSYLDKVKRVEVVRVGQSRPTRWLVGVVYLTSTTVTTHSPHYLFPFFFPSLSFFPFPTEMERPGFPKEESQVVATRAVAGLGWEEGGQRKTTQRERERMGSEC